MSSSSGDAHLATLAKTNQLLTEQFRKDASKIPDPEELLLSSSGTSSSYASAPNHAWTPFELRKTMMIPEELFSDFEPTKSTCSMGLFPQIDRAWIALNNKLFLWDYVTTKDSLQSFPEQPGNVTYVGLIKPKPGIFIDAMQHLLVVCTQSQLIVLGIAAPDTPIDPNSVSQEFVVYDTELRFPTENVVMTSIVSTNAGRAFMCGVTDGHLYELQYQATEGWFGGRSSLYNHSTSGVTSFLPSLFSAVSNEFITLLALDDSRDLLYALTSVNSIIVFEASGKTTAPLRRIGVASELSQQAQRLCPPLGQSRLDIIAISHMPVTESNGIHLIAVTSTGVRLYFTTFKRSYTAYGPSSSPSSLYGPPSCLSLVHVRLGPTGLFDPRTIASPSLGESVHRASTSSSLQKNSSRFTQWQATNLNVTGYHGGLFFASQTASDDAEQDILLCTAPDLPRLGNLRQQQSVPSTAPVPFYRAGGIGPSSQPVRQTYSETTFLLALTGKAWAIDYLPAIGMPSSPGSRTPLWNDLITQFSSYPEQILILTNDGLSVVAKRRAIDCLRDLIEAARRGSDESMLTAFFEEYGRDQACAMCLAIACLNSFVSAGVLQAPLSSAKLLDGALSQLGNSVNGSEGIVEDGVTLAAKTLFYEFGQAPANYPNASAVAFSGRHEGFALYFSRLVRPIWTSKITTGPVNSQTPNIPVSVLSVVQRDLQSLKSFLERNPQLFAAPGNYSSSFNGNNDGQQSAWKEEDASVSQLRELLGLTIEAISFILLLIDYKLPDTISLLEPSYQKALQSMTWEQLLTQQSGRDLGKALVTAVINQQISQQISIDAISEVLQSRSPNFCSTDDVMMYKAVESLRRAKETRNSTERSESLRESLRLLLKSTRNLRSGLDEICEDYRYLSFPDGAILLPLQCAKDWDADLQGRDFWLSGAGSDQDPRKAAYDTRTKCYDLILAALLDFDEKISLAKTETAAADAEVLQGTAYQLALDSEDAVFHSYLYDWFISQDRTDALLDIRSPFIEDYLRREPRTWQKCELLWQFYVSHGLFLLAAETLADLAENRDFGMRLEKRIEYLSLAFGNAKSHQVSDFDANQQAPVEFLTDLDEKLEVANVQFEVYEIMKSTRNLGESGLGDVELLGTRLLDITTLYHSYAEPYNLYDMKLLILKVSDHRDPQVVAATWRTIFETAEEDPSQAPAVVSEHVRRLGQKLYPSDNAFPCDLVCALLQDVAWNHRAELPQGWTPQVMLDAHVPYEAVFESLYTMREAGQPPYHTKERELFLIADITYLMNSWLTETLRPHGASSSSGNLGVSSRGLVGRFPADVVDQTISAYLELLPLGIETQDLRKTLSEMQRKVRARF